MMHSVTLRVAWRRVTLGRALGVQKAMQSSQTAPIEHSADSDEYWDEPRYPPILDVSLAARKLRARDAVHEKIKKLNTIEEKQIALNMPRFYGFKCVRFYEDKVQYAALPLVQFYTRTHLVPGSALPDAYAESDPAAELVAKEIKTLVEEAIAVEYHGVKRQIKYDLSKPEKQQAEDAVARGVAKQLTRIITNNLADKLPHILSAQVDFDPRHEAFWFVGGVDPPKLVKMYRKGHKCPDDKLNDPVDRPVQYTGSPLLAMRSNLPLRPLVAYSEAENPSLTVPKYTYHPETTGYSTVHMHGSNIPGFWPGDQDEFGLISVHGRGHILARKESFGPKDNLEALHCQAIKSSFGWLAAQAAYQGFDPFNDLTYPLVTQTIITNGQLWSLYAYQLNTISMHNEKIDENPKRNICFGTEPLKLFEGFDDKGNVVGFNEDVLKQIVKLYINTPEAREYDMKPYLGDEEQVVADIEDDPRRNWLENTYKYVVSNRPRHRLPPEVYLWERIYKIQFKTRFREARRRPFELGVNPYQRRLNEHTPTYIPKVLRAFPKSKKKWEKTYYPDV